MFDKKNSLSVHFFIHASLLKIPHKWNFTDDIILYVYTFSFTEYAEVEDPLWHPKFLYEVKVSHTSWLLKDLVQICKAIIFLTGY